MNILLCDDDLTFVESMKELVTTYAPEMSLMCVGTLAEAVTILQDPTTDIQLIVLDLALPDASDTLGLRMLIKQSPDIPIAILTEYKEHETEQALNLGARVYWLKDGLEGESLIGSMKNIVKEYYHLAG